MAEKPSYVVRLRGKAVTVMVRGEPRDAGFYVNRIETAADSRQAGVSAIRRVTEEVRERGIAGDKALDIEVVEISQLDGDVEVDDSGFAFFLLGS